VRYEESAAPPGQRRCNQQGRLELRVTRPTFHKARCALQTVGLAGLLPRRRGPKAGHKVSLEVIAFVADLKAGRPELTTLQCLDAIEARFGTKVHRRNLERALARKKRLSPA
jgi:hypothetical protein